MKLECYTVYIYWNVDIFQGGDHNMNVCTLCMCCALFQALLNILNDVFVNLG